MDDLPKGRVESFLCSIYVAVKGILRCGCENTVNGERLGAEFTN
jgi:hypothetical protein